MVTCLYQVRLCSLQGTIMYSSPSLLFSLSVVQSFENIMWHVFIVCGNKDHDANEYQLNIHCVNFNSSNLSFILIKGWWRRKKHSTLKAVNNILCLKALKLLSPCYISDICHCTMLHFYSGCTDGSLQSLFHTIWEIFCLSWIKELTSQHLLLYLFPLLLPVMT